jgi:ribosomal protein S18 acetylase RimI-like enzyme
VTTDQCDLDDLVLTVHRTGTATSQLTTVVGIYASAYSEPPYNEGPDDVAQFRSDWARRVSQPTFRLVIATLAHEPIGFAFGHQLPPGTRWWDGLLEDVERDIIDERPGRTFAVIELAVLQGSRERGIGRELHAHLLANLQEERATLLVRPEATPARRAYQAWGYWPVGKLQPFPDAPTYDAMIKHLEEPGHPDGR